MPISNHDDVIREITMMVRKGSIQFDMNDRPVLDLNRTDRNTGKKVSYCIGSIGRDDMTSELFYTLYTTDGEFVPSVKGPRSLDSLYAKELLAVRDCVAKYFDMALNRSRNIQDIVKFMDEHPEGFKFDGTVKPSAFVPNVLNVDENLEMKIDSIFLPDSAISKEKAIYCHGDIANGVSVTTRVGDLNDRAIANIFTCLGLDKNRLTQKHVVEKARPQKRSSNLSV